MNRWAGVGSIRAIHTTVAGQRSENRQAFAAFIKPLTRVRGHGLVVREIAQGTGEYRFERDRGQLDTPATVEG